MTPAGFILTGQRRYADQMHPPLVVAHSLSSDFFGIDERADPYPTLHSFNVWPATAAVLDQLRASDHILGHSRLDEFSQWHDRTRPPGRRIIICTGEERARAKLESEMLAT